MKYLLKEQFKDHKPPRKMREKLSKHLCTLLEKGEQDSAEKILTDFTLKIFAEEITGEDSNPIDSEQSLMEQGMQSSGAFLLRNALSDALDLHLPLSLLFEHSSLTNLTQHLLNLLCQQLGQQPQEEYYEQERQQIELDIAQAQSLKFRSCVGVENVSLETSQHILLTGATGFFGIHMLAHILANSSAKIHCIVRAYILKILTHIHTVRASPHKCLVSF